MNMNHEYRAELKSLRASERKARNEYARLARVQAREAAAHHRAVTACERRKTASQRDCAQALSRITTRIAILEGRLS